jgi:hypothetical protein
MGLAGFFRCSQWAIACRIIFKRISIMAVPFEIDTREAADGVL